MTNNTSILTQDNFHEDIVNYFKEDSEFVHLLEPLLKALGWPGAYKHLVEALPHYAQTLDLTGFRNVMAMLNYHSQAVEINFKDVVIELMPALFIPKDQLAMILIKTTNDGVVCYDAATKDYKMVPFQNIEGTLYIFQPLQSVNATKGTTNWFSKSFKRFHSIFLQVFLMSLLINMFLLVSPLFIMGVFDKVFSSDSVSMLIQLTLGVSITLAGGYILNKMRTHMLSYVGARLDITVGDAILQRLLFLAPSYTENATVGAQIARIKDFDSIREFFTSPSVSVLFELPFALVFLAAIWMLGGWIILIPLAMLLVFSILFYIVNPYIVKSIKQTADFNAKKQAFQLETLSNMRSIRLMGAQQHWLDRFKDITSKSLASEFFSSMITQSLNIVSETIMMISGLLVVGFGVLQVIDGNMSVGALIATMMLVWRVLAPIKTFFSMLPRLDQIITSVKQINHLMKIPLERDPHKIVQPIAQKEGKIEFNRVSFRYRSDMMPTLLGINFKINPGELVAICGQNGCGKSTLLKLIADLYPIQAGNIFLDNMNLRQIDVIELRQSIGYLPQNTCLFYGTIAQNLRFAEPLASLDELVDATRLAGVYDEIRTLPKGFDTRIGDHAGGALSRSFQQKLMLARTFLKKSSILLLDEPTNYLDFEMTEQFNETIKSLRGKTTVLLVTHRPGQMKMADRILYLEQGHLLFNGPPKDVLPKLPLDLL